MNTKKIFSLLLTLTCSFSSISNTPLLGAQLLVETSGGSALKVLVLTIVSLLKNDKEETFTIEAKSSDTINFLQKEIEKRTQFPSQYQQLAFKRTYLEPNKTISAYSIHDGAELCVFEKTKNIQFNFSNLKNKINMKSSNSNLPSKGLEFFPGMNLIGECKNENCDVTYKHQVMAPKGFGIFYLGTEIYTTKCPCCNKGLENITTCAFSYCKYKIEGIRAKSGKFSNKQEIHNKINEYELFIAGDDETTDTYNFIKITVEKL